MRVGFSVSTDAVYEEMKNLEPYVDYFETFALSDEQIETIEEYIEQITVVHLPDLNNNCIESLQQATKLEIEKAVVHYYTVNPWSHEEKLNTLRRLVQVAEENNILLCIENTEEDPVLIGEIINRTPGLGFCLDIGHGNIFSNTPSDFIKHLREHLTHIHIHDNHGGDSEAADIHLIPGEGNIDFNATLQELKKRNYNDDFTLELIPMDTMERKITGLKHTRALIQEHWRRTNGIS